MNPLITRVETAVRDHLAPALGVDPSEITVVAVEDGIASLRLSGACASCPASLPTLLVQMENELRQHVPEVEMLEVVM
jgi:Fe-S cluster biogenesis protein NfuA